jgi:PAS domain S-box-containing protein
MTTPPDASPIHQLFDLEYFFELSPDLLCVAGYDGYFKKINPAVPKTLGYTYDELFASPIDSFVHIEDRNITAKKRESIKNDNPLLNFENRYVTKSGDIVWLTWTSMPIKKDRLVFAIAKNITYKKKLEEYRRIAGLMANGAELKNGGQEKNELTASEISNATTHLPVSYPELSHTDQDWLNELELLIRKHAGKIDLNISMVSAQMNMSERQLFRRIRILTGITPNKFIRIVRLQLSREAIESGKYRTVAEIAYAAGFATPSYFSKLFREIYCVDASELLK